MTKIDPTTPAELVPQIAAARARPLGATLEQAEAREGVIRETLCALDQRLWRRRRHGETVAAVRARLAPEVVW